MKIIFLNISKSLFFLLTVFLLTIVSCETESVGSDDEGDDDDISSTCSAPTDLEITVIEETFFGDNVELTWTSNGDESSWEVILEQSIWNDKKTFVVDEPTIKVAQVLDSDKAVFTVKALCTDDLSSEAVVFPSLDLFTGTLVANMTASINGVQYNSLKPAISAFGSASGVDFSFSHDGVHLHLQGRTGSVFSASREINLFINETQWAVGTYEIRGEAEDDFIDKEVESYVTYFNSVESEFDFSITEPGVLEITKFDLDERIIEGTFSFSYEKEDSNGVTVIENVENGTFVYSLDDEYFD